MFNLLKAYFLIFVAVTGLLYLITDDLDLLYVHALYSVPAAFLLILKFHSWIRRSLRNYLFWLAGLSLLSSSHLIVAYFCSKFFYLRVVCSADMSFASMLGFTGIEFVMFLCSYVGVGTLVWGRVIKRG